MRAVRGLPADLSTDKPPTNERLAPTRRAFALPGLVARVLGQYDDELLKRDKVSLDIFWLKDESLEDTENLPDPDVIAAEIAEDLEAALAQFAEIAGDLKR